MATFSVTEKRPAKVEAKVVFEFNAEEVQFLAVATRYYNTTNKFGTVVTQLENAARQAKAIENG